MGSRSCLLCGPSIEGCWRCRATYGHRHLTVTSRDGTSLRVAVCADHAPQLPETAEQPAQPTGSVVVGRERKLAYDRARRKALAALREAHRDEWERLLRQEVADA